MASSEPHTFEEGELFFFEGDESSLVLMIITEGGGGDGVSDSFLIMTVTLPSLRRRREGEGLTPSQLLRTRSPAFAVKQCHYFLPYQHAVQDWYKFNEHFLSPASTCSPKKVTWNFTDKRQGWSSIVGALIAIWYQKIQYCCIPMQLYSRDRGT